MGEHRIADGAYSVIVIDMFHYDDESEMIIRGFPKAELAREYARSARELRSDGLPHDELRERWFIFGEDCVVIGDSYTGFSELDFFIDHPATPEEKDWMAIEKLVTTMA